MASSRPRLMRYFLDTEYDGFGGPLLSLALVPDDGGDEFYAVIEHESVTNEWVARHVIPYLDHVPVSQQLPRLGHEQAARSLASWLAREHEAHTLARWPEETDTLEIVADWPEDIALFCKLITTGPGRMVEVPPLSFRLISIPGFSTAANSAVPHNALHDARALRDHIMNHLE